MNDREIGLYKNGRLWWLRTVRAPLLNQARSLSTGTPLLKRANAIARMVEQFGENPTQYHWLSRAVSGDVSLDRIYVHHAAGTLQKLQEQLDAPNEPDLDEWVQTFLAKYVASLDITERSKSDYARHLRYFIPAGVRFPASKLTSDFLREQIAAIGLAGQTRRQYYGSMRQFVTYLLRKRVLLADPMFDVPWPKKGAPRSTYLEYPKIRSVLECVTDPACKAALALLFGSGMELGALMALRGEDVGDGTVVAHGTKNQFRESRTIFVDQWAWPIFQAHARRILPKGKVFTFTPARLRLVFYNAQVAAGMIAKPLRVGTNQHWHAVEPHTLHDCRHSYALNRLLGLDGEPARDIGYVSAQLGHADETMVVRIYNKKGIGERLRLSQERQKVQARPSLSILGSGG